MYQTPETCQIENLSDIYAKYFGYPSTGYFVDFFGWYYFFIFCFILAIPGMFLLLKIAPWRK